MRLTKRLVALLGLTALVPAPGLAAGLPDLLPQGWTTQERHAFWFTPQGSRVLSYDLFLGIEQANSEELFKEPANLEQFGAIPWPAGPLNLDGLPIGFVREPGASEDKA